MVRPCRMVLALLVLLATHRPSSSGTSAETETETGGDAAAVAANFTEITPAVRCNYKGRSYEPGSSVNTDQPCLKCTCVAGNLVCQLQVCPEMPDPPPQGCVVVHKKNKCCAHLQCYYEQFGAVHSKRFSSQTDSSRSGPARMENSAAIVTHDGSPKGCVINGTVYAEGSAMDSSSLCEYCYCIKGRQQCVRPRCSLTVAGCTAVYNKHTCCPVRYKCSPLHNNASLTKNTTDAPTTETSLSARLKDCRINGRLISLGEPVIGVARSSCETCFCINGQVRCDKVICPPIRARISPDCGPVYSEGHCCPTSYDCTGRRDETRVSTTTTSTTTTNLTTTIATSPSTVTIADDALPGSPSPPTPVTSAIPAEATAAESTRPSADLKNNATTDPMESRHANPAGLTLDDFGALNVTEKSNKFEMDYDEPTLPPSLPNLKIIPFVAADAVVDEPAAAPYDNDYQPVMERVYNVSDVAEPPSPVVNSFSPPIETEGGFVPKDSPPDGAAYTAEEFRATTERVPAVPAAVRPDGTVVAAREPVIGSVWCVSSDGDKYKHGELLTDPSACDICVCFDGKIVCQENCPAVRVGCQRISDPDNVTCCGRIVCDESENDIGTERVRPATATTKRGDAVVEHIIIAAATTEKRVVVTTAPPPPPATEKPERPTTTTTTPAVRPTTPVATPAVRPTTPVATPAVRTTRPAVTATTSSAAIAAPGPSEDEDYSSFESMFSFLFSGDTTSERGPSAVPPETTATAAAVPPETTADRPVADTTRVQHRTDDETTDEKDATPPPPPPPLPPRQQVDVQTRFDVAAPDADERRTDVVGGGGGSRGGGGGGGGGGAAAENATAGPALKISGCNIYGRMYRVGKIIAELSDPCLECMCTDVGVHCNQLKC